MRQNIQKQTDNIIREIESLPEQSLIAAIFVLNRTAEWLKGHLSKEISTQKRVKLKLIRDRILVQEDGLMGPETLLATSNSDTRYLLAAIKSEAAGYYRQIAAKNPSQQKILKRWLNRAYKVILF